MQKELLRKRARALFEACFRCAEEGAEDEFLSESSKYSFFAKRNRKPPYFCGLLARFQCYGF